MTTTETETPPTVAERWVEALRSGKYKQGQKYLHVGDTFCCLGVLCDLDGDAGWEHADDTERDTEGNTKPIYVTADGATGMPMGEVLMWANLSERQAERLAELNDNGDTFEQIADEIEELYASGDNEVEDVGI